MQYIEWPIGGTVSSVCPHSKLYIKSNQDFRSDVPGNYFF